MTSLKLQRSGQFTIRLDGPNHCGIGHALTMAYHVAVTCGTDSLDERGFLFDQMSVVNYFARQTHTALSCEQYALHCSRELFKAIRNENPRCNPQAIVLTLSPNPEASMTFSWTADEPKAHNKRRKVTV